MNQLSDSSFEELGFRLPSSALLKKALFSWLRINRINELLGDEALQTSGIHFIDGLFKKLSIRYNISEEDLKNIPTNQPFIILSNHPFGFLDGLIMIHLIARIRPDFKVLANFFLKQFGALDDYFIDLNPFETNSTQNYRGMRQAYQNLKAGSPVGLFPAGEVATMQKGLSKIEDRAWDISIIRFILNANVPIIPLHFEGQPQIVVGIC